MQRRSPESEPVVFRVFHLPQALRDAVQSKRKENGQTLKEFTWQSIDASLAPLVQALTEVLPNPAGPPRRPMRFPLSDRLLAELREAGNTVGIPSTRLLLALLQLAAQTEASPKRGRRGGRKKAAGAITDAPAETPQAEGTPHTDRPTRRRGRKRKNSSPDNPTSDQPTTHASNIGGPVVERQ